MTIEIAAYTDSLSAATVGGTAYNALISQDGVAKRAPTTMAGRFTEAFKAAGTDIAYPTDFGPINFTTSPSICTWKLHTFYFMGYTRVPGTTQGLTLMYERRFLGQLTITSAQYRGEVASQAAMLATSTATQGDWVQRTDDTGAGSRGGKVYLLTGTTFSTLAHWTAIPMATANRPNIAWGTVADNTAMVALSNAIVGDFCVNTAQSGNTYVLTASPPATLANWVADTTSSKPSNPQITQVLNGNDASSLLRDQTGMMRTGGIGNDYWIS